MYSFSLLAHISPGGLLPDPSETNISHKDEKLGLIRYSMRCSLKSPYIYFILINYSPKKKPKIFPPIIWTRLERIENYFS